MVLKRFLISSVLFAASVFYFGNIADASANIAIDSASLEDRVNAAFILENSRPTFNPYSGNNQEAQLIGYYFDATKKDFKLKQFVGTQGLAHFPFTNNTKLSFADVVPYGIIVDYEDWDRYKTAVVSVDVDNCLDCALYNKTKDPYKLKDHLVSMRAFTTMVANLKTRSNYALKQSTYDRLMKTDPKFAEARTKAETRGYKLCPVAPDDFTGLNLQSYVAKVNKHMSEVEAKMKLALE